MMITHSINKASYIMANGCECTYKLVKGNKVAYIFDQPIAEVYAEEYENDEQLRAFLDAYKEIRQETRRIKDICNIK